MLFLKIYLLIYLSYTLPSSAERRAGEDRENNGTTPRQQKVRFVKICTRHWLFSARGFPREFPSGHSGTSGTAIPLPLGCPALRDPRNARGVLGRTLRFRPRVSPRLYTLPPTLYTQKSQNFNIFCDSICSYQKNVVYLRL